MYVLFKVPSIYSHHAIQNYYAMTVIKSALNALKKHSGIVLQQSMHFISIYYVGYSNITQNFLPNSACLSRIYVVIKTIIIEIFTHIYKLGYP